MAKQNRTILIHAAANGLDVAAAEGSSVKIERLTCNSGENISGLLARSADILASLGVTPGQETCLGLPSNIVFSAVVERGDLPRRGRQTALLYRLEEVLPLDAESLTADFTSVSAEQSFGVAARTADVKKLLDELAGTNLEVSTVCPTALLIAWQICKLRENSAEGARRPDWIVIGLDGRVDIIRLHQGKPRTWYSCLDNYEELSCWLGADIMALPPQDSPGLMISAGIPDVHNIRRLSEKFGLTSETCELSPMELAAKAAESAATGQIGGWVNLRKDGLALAKPWARFKGLVQAVAVLAVLLPLVLAGSFYIRSVRYDDASRQMRKEMTDIYRQFNPGASVPPQIKSAIEAQYNKLAAVTGCGLDSGLMPNSLNTLRAAAVALPPDIRMQISDIQADPAGIYITGEVLQHSDVEIIARALRKTGFNVDATPSSRQSERGVSFRLKAGALQKQPSPERTATQ